MKQEEFVSIVNEDDLRKAGIKALNSLYEARRALDRAKLTGVFESLDEIELLGFIKKNVLNNVQRNLDIARNDLYAFYDYYKSYPGYLLRVDVEDRLDYIDTFMLDVFKTLKVSRTIKDTILCVDILTEEIDKILNSI